MDISKSHYKRQNQSQSYPVREKKCFYEKNGPPTTITTGMLWGAQMVFPVKYGNKTSYDAVDRVEPPTGNG